MSVRVMSLVWDSTVRAPERFTLLALADRSDEDGVCWPSIPTLARKCQVGESTIRRHLAALEELGVLSKQQRFNASSVYTIDLVRLRQLTQPDRTPSQSDRGSQPDTPSQSERTPSQIGTPPPPNLSGPPSQSERLSIIDPSGDPSENHQGGRKRPRVRGTRIPDDFTVTDDMKQWARAHTPLVGQTESDLFIDYWQAESGTKAVKSDWRKAWQVWMRREQKRAEQTGRRPAHPSRPTADDKISALQSLKTGTDGPSNVFALPRGDLQ